MTKYRIVFRDNQELKVSKATVDEKNRVVTEAIKTKDGFRYNYYPFEGIFSIKYLEEENPFED